MGRHAKSFNVIWDTAVAYWSLLVAFLHLSVQVTNQHVLGRRPEGGATPEYADELADWKQATEVMPAVIVWPTIDPDVVVGSEVPA